MVIEREILPLMTVGEVSRVLHVHTNTVRRWSDQGILKAYRIGSRGDRRFAADDISKFLVGLGLSNGDERKAAHFNNLLIHV